MSKKKKLKQLPTFNHLKVKQIEQAITNVVEAYMSDPSSRPTAEPISKYQQSMGRVLGWDLTETLGPCAIGDPRAEEWPKNATHFTIPVRPFKYELEKPVGVPPISNGI